MAGSIFKQEKQMISDDPLQFLLNLIGYEYRRYHLYIKIICLFIVLYIEVFNIVCFVDVFVNGDWNLLKRYLPVIILQQPGAMGLSLGIISANEFFTFRQVVFQYCWSINSAGTHILEKIQKDCKSIKQLCFAVFLTNLLVYASFLPLIGDEGDIIYVVMLARRYFGNWANLSCCIYYFCFLCFAYGNVIVLFICAYIIYHLRFQFYLINEHLQTLCDDYDLEGAINYDDSYQRNVYERLVLCVDQHVNIKRVARMFSHITRAPIAGVTIIASSVFVATAFFIASGVSPHSNFRMCLSSLSCLTILMSVCTFGEMLAVESNYLYLLCLESPWPLWNRRNKYCYLMLMLGCYRPLKITFYNLLDLNYTFLLKIVSLTYKLQALFLKFK